jgi:hypothetical protein
MSAEQTPDQIAEDTGTKDGRYRRYTPPGLRVEIRSPFDRRWCAGFEIAEIVVGREGVEGFRVRRLADGAVLPAVFPATDLMTERGGSAA